MSETPPLRSLDRDPRLVAMGIYEREVAASLERVWENVYDWEHLPWLHAEAFTSIERLSSGDWGWHAKVGFHGGSQAEIELVTDRSAGRYVARTRTGAGAPGEIWTSLAPLGAERTGVRVEFRLASAIPEATRESIARGFITLYTRLWDQDESMMRTRESALRDRKGAARSQEGAEHEIALGPLGALHPRLPLIVELGGHRYRIVELAEERDGQREIVAYSTVCPHLLGPLGACEVEDGLVTCPWHGDRFDVRTGRGVDGRRLRLRPAPRVVIERATGQVRLVERAEASAGSRRGERTGSV